MAAQPRFFDSALTAKIARCAKAQRNHPRFCLPVVWRQLCVVLVKFLTWTSRSQVHFCDAVGISACPFLHLTRLERAGERAFA
jgi:hypothetical protein